MTIGSVAIPGKAEGTANEPVERGISLRFPQSVGAVVGSVGVGIARIQEQEMTILFLDFDGVLHPSSVYLRSGRPVLESGGAGELFMWADILESVLDDRQQSDDNIRIVLSTNWCRRLGWQRTRDALPEGLRWRVIGSTYHSQARDWYDNVTRYAQICRYLARRQSAEPWLALDDLHEGDEIADWAAINRDRLILTDPDRGLSDPAAVAALRAALDRS